MDRNPLGHHAALLADQFNHNAAAHPHLQLDSGKTLVTVSFNSQNVFTDFNLYRPRFYELEP